MRRGALSVTILLVLLAVPALAYEDVDPRRLESELKGWVGRQVRFIDQVAIEWTIQDQRGWIRFDTYRFRCMIREGLEADVALLRDTLASRFPPRLLTFSGTVQDRNGMLMVEIDSVRPATYPRKGQRRIVWWD